MRYVTNVHYVVQIYGHLILIHLVVPTCYIQEDPINSFIRKKTLMYWKG
jgi:hypothetical protein